MKIPLLNKIMNKSFTKTEELVLDEKHSIKPDSDNGVILVSVGEPKTNKKGETITPRTEYHFPRIAQALRKYADLTLNANFNDIAFNSEKVYIKIDELDETFKQF